MRFQYFFLIWRKINSYRLAIIFSQHLIRRTDCVTVNVCLKRFHTFTLQRSVSFFKVNCLFWRKSVFAGSTPCFLEFLCVSGLPIVFCKNCAIMKNIPASSQPYQKNVDRRGCSNADRNQFHKDCSCNENAPLARRGAAVRAADGGPLTCGLCQCREQPRRANRRGRRLIRWFRQLWGFQWKQYY